MGVRKLSISLSSELADAIDGLAQQRGDDRSRLLETLLREHVLVQAAIASWREAPPPKQGPQRERAGHRSRLVVTGRIDL